MKNIDHSLKCLAALAAGLMLGLMPARAVDFHVATAQQLQNALTLAAASSVSNNIYVTNGYYTGNFNFNSTNVNSLTVLAETNVASSQVVIDSGGTGSSMNIIGSATANITVQGMTFLRNCGNSAIGSLQIAGGNTTILVSGCLFLSPTNSSGIGLQLVSGINVTVTNCIAAGSQVGGGGTGIYISRVTNTVAVQNCMIKTNTGSGLIVGGANVVTITDNAFTGNSTPYYSAEGGGAYCSGTTVTLSGNSFSGNSSITGSYPRGGGGVACYGTTAIFTGNTFTGNSAGYNCSYGGCSGGGGGALCNSTTTALTNNTFTGNSAPGYNGGGVACSGTAILIGNTFTGNSAAYGGGAYGGNCRSGGDQSDGALTLTGNTFKQNFATTSGGGIYANVATTTISDNLVVNNGCDVSGTGGGIWMKVSSTLFLINNTITANNSAGNGGGVAFQVSGVVEQLNVFNNIIWGNLATVNGGDVYLTGTGQQKVFNFNDADSLYGVWDIAVNNLDLSPQFFDPVNGDYHIQSTSPCKDAGTNGTPSLPATDMDGGPRIANGTVDLGCYEFNTAITHPADTNADFVLTAAEYNAYAVAWKAGQTWSNAPVVIPADYVTRAGYLMTNGGAYHNDGSARPVNWKTGP